MTPNASIGAAPDPEAEARVRDSFARQGLMAHLGARLSRVAHGLVCIALPYRPELTQQHGYFHAGGTSSIADSAGGYAGLTVFPPGSEVLTVEFKLNLLAPAQGTHLVAEGRVLRAGRTLTVCQLEVSAHEGTEGPGRLVAAGQQTLICLPGRGATAETGAG
ncbi:PaaI family thioesterase (plasmid) [Paroceanicella profunda]|uniref:Medium/long-chain acyl-CoA thioesterase YigI n=1 Tax=Paroceanicella profunda TaxID=2579971 RepID=A0A5B8FYS5_9RHOB|nr:PaaI family thioesterase [Paroceanicella profunda]QDL94056.1 PaaI family thioesterase [Paroceanicella profunda]